jgi:transitional endoplasmic reticulum ATPase
MSTVDLPRAPDLPGWMTALRDRYLHTETGQFVLHGNINDMVVAAGRVWSMTAFLDQFFSPSDKVVVHYDPGRGVWFAKPEHAARAAKVLVEAGLYTEQKLGGKPTTEKMRWTAMGESLVREIGLERDPAVVLPQLEALLVRRDTPCAVVIHYAELVAPDGMVGNLGFADRTAAATLHRWSLWDEVVRSDNLVMLLCSTLTGLARRVTGNPRVGVVRVPLPGALDRARYLAQIRPTLDPDRGETLTRITAGLQLRQIQDLMAMAEPVAQPVQSLSPTETRAVFQSAPASLPVGAIADRKKEILEQECAGLIEVIEADHDFSVVGGMEPIKDALMRVAGHIKAGRKSQVPMGIMLVGPMGTGKSFVAEAFAAECGLPVITLKNFRGGLVGATEANLERVLSVIEGLGEIVVIIDEADRTLSGGNGDGGVDSRVIARLKEFMSDTSHRGRIVFIMMTNRPDKLDTDLKRPGRLDMKIPFFHPQTGGERLAILRALIRRHKIDAAVPDEEILPVLGELEGYASADLEALLLLAFDDFCAGHLPEGVETVPEKLTTPYLVRAVADYMPTREKDMVRYMEWLAVSEASNRRLLPDRFRSLSLDELSDNLAAARRKALKLEW